MCSQIFSQLALFAQGENAAGAAQQAPGTAQSLLSMSFMVFFFLIAMYLLFVLPKKRQDKQMKQLFDSLKKDDRVMTSCGIIATVYSVDKEAGEVVLKVDETTKIRFSISSVYYIFPEKDAAKSAAPSEKK